jgi:hypothetical protein
MLKECYKILMPTELTTKQRTDHTHKKRCRHVATNMDYHRTIYRPEITIRNKEESRHPDQIPKEKTQIIIRIIQCLNHTII